jgi:ferric-dicitrate binding protein FerR (iron transport regulator)
MQADRWTEARIDEAAARWLVDIKDAETWQMDQAGPESFVSWLAQSPRHSYALFLMARAWRQLDMLSGPRRNQFLDRARRQKQPAPPAK